MRYLFACPVWAKPDAVGTLAFGMARTNAGRPGNGVIFISDGPYLDVVAQTDQHLGWLRDHFEDARAVTNHGDPGESQCHNIALRAFLESPGYDALVVIQDDHVLSGTRLLADLDNVLAAPFKVGVVGGRDGFNHCMADMVSSPWSESVGGRRLRVGEYEPRDLLNRGPFVYTRRVVEEVGLLDTESYSAWYIETDYCARARRAGFTNFALGTEVIHYKFGRVLASQIYDGRQAADHAVMMARHPNMHH